MRIVKFVKCFLIALLDMIVTLLTITVVIKVLVRGIVPTVSTGSEIAGLLPNVAIWLLITAITWGISWIVASPVTRLSVDFMGPPRGPMVISSWASLIGLGFRASLDVPVGWKVPHKMLNFSRQAGSYSHQHCPNFLQLEPCKHIKSPNSFNLDPRPLNLQPEP